MDATIRFAIACWVVGIAVWILLAFSVKRTRTQQPLRHRLVYLVLTAVAAILLSRSAWKTNWHRAVFPHTVVTGILGDFLLLMGLLIAVWARISLGGNWSARVA